MGEAKEVDDSPADAKFAGCEHKIPSFKAINFQKFHQKFGIEVLSSCDIDGRFFKFYFIHDIFGDGGAIGNEDAFVIFSKCIESFDAFLHAHGIFAGGVIGF